MFKTFKPKGDRVKAVQVTPEIVEELARNMMGRLMKDDNDEVFGFEYPTFDGIKQVEFDRWLVLKTDGTAAEMSPEEFEATYEPAYNSTRA